MQIHTKQSCTKTNNKTCWKLIEKATNFLLKPNDALVQTIENDQFVHTNESVKSFRKG